MMSHMNMNVGDAGCGEGKSGVMEKGSRARCMRIQYWLLEERYRQLATSMKDLDFEITLCTTISFIGVLFGLDMRRVVPLRDFYVG
jgi:hypothetical protein